MGVAPIDSAIGASAASRILWSGSHPTCIIPRLRRPDRRAIGATRVKSSRQYKKAIVSITRVTKSSYSEVFLCLFVLLTIDLCFSCANCFARQTCRGGRWIFRDSLHANSSHERTNIPLASLAPIDELSGPPFILNSKSFGCGRRPRCVSCGYPEPWSTRVTFSGRQITTANSRDPHLAQALHDLRDNLARTVDFIGRRKPAQTKSQTRPCQSIGDSHRAEHVAGFRVRRRAG